MMTEATLTPCVRGSGVRSGKLGPVKSFHENGADGSLEAAGCSEDDWLDEAISARSGSDVELGTDVAVLSCQLGVVVISQEKRPLTRKVSKTMRLEVVSLLLLSWMPW